MTTLGDRIRRERKKQGFSQDRLCMGICSQSSLSRLESNDLNISLITVNRIIAKLNLSFKDLLVDEETIKESVFTNELDQARDNRDYEGIERIVRNYCEPSDPPSDKVKMYMKWHQGLVSFSKGNYEKSVEQLDHAIFIAEKNKFNGYLPHLYMAKGNAKLYLGERALRYYAYADELYRSLKIDDFRLEMKILYNLIVSYSREEQYHQVILKCKKAVKTLSVNQSSYLMCDVYYLWMKALICLGDIEDYKALSAYTRILFEHNNCMEMLDKLENYSTVNN